MRRLGREPLENIFLAASPRVSGSKKPPCYTGYHTMGQVPAYKRLKTIENYKTVRLISGHGHYQRCLFTRDSDLGILLGKFWCF